MVLGSILTQPNDLESSLNHEKGIKPFPADKRVDQSEATQLFVKSELSKKSGGRLKALLPVTPLASAGAGFEATASGSIESTVEALDIRAEIIMPYTATSFVQDALSTPEILSYVRDGLFAKPLYLIVGVATCKKLFIGDTVAQDREASVQGNASLAGSGIDVEAGVSKARNSSAGAELHINTECDFAYRVRQFSYSKLRKKMVKSVDVTDGALFGDDTSRDSTTDSDMLYEEVAVFEDFDSQDEEF
jgi:hypothetical protein